MSKPETFLKFSSQMLYILYDCDIVDENSVRIWHLNLLEDEEAPNKQLWKETKRFVEWLENAEEASSSSASHSQ